jgi:ABC transport system ATP-binding/permease protein
MSASMATLLSTADLGKSFASHTLFEGVSLQVFEKDRLGIIGPNGAGKSTLLKILAGHEGADVGEMTRRRSLRVVYVAQDDLFEPAATPMSALIDVIHRAADDPDHHEQLVERTTAASIILSKLGFIRFNDPIGTLSGGWRKRAALARALAQEPDVLLLDEPTNHLDLEGIVWLERFMRQSNLALVFITHDRRFLENVATRIVELAPSYPGGTFEVQGNYSEFVRRKERFLDGQSAAESVLANLVRRDTAWLEQGVQARRTRNKTQVEDTQERHSELKAIKNRNEAPARTTVIDFQATERKTQRLLALHNVSKSMGERRLFAGIDLVLSPGRRIGLLGPNGSGKSTLLRLMSGELKPDTGTIKQAADLRMVVFSQHREDLNPTQTLQEALCPVGDTVDYRGKPIHVTGWARKFLFAATQLNTYVSNLSGGEKARVLIARLMLEPADVLLLDEPTNDLDIPSLEVLEQALMEFPGAIVLVTHDRFMLERISTEFFALDGHGGAGSCASMLQWQQSVRDSKLQVQADGKVQRSEPATVTTTSSPKKLSYKLQREFDGMEHAIHQAEAEVQRLQALAGNGSLAADHVRQAEVYRMLAEAQTRTEQLYARWAELETMQRTQ